MIDVQRTDFVSVLVTDMERALKFYGETLGLQRNEQAHEDWPEFETGNLTLALMTPQQIGREEFTPNTMYIALRVPDVQAARRTLEEAGVEFRGDILDSSVCHMTFFSDPDGNNLMLHKRYAPYADGSSP